MKVQLNILVSHYTTVCLNSDCGKVLQRVARSATKAFPMNEK